MASPGGRANPGMFWAGRDKGMKNVGVDRPGRARQLDAGHANRKDNVLSSGGQDNEQTQRTRGKAAQDKLRNICDCATGKPATWQLHQGMSVVAAERTRHLRRMRAAAKQTRASAPAEPRANQQQTSIDINGSKRRGARSRQTALGTGQFKAASGGQESGT